MHSVDVESYFEEHDLAESLAISIRPYLERGLVELVFVYANEAVSTYYASALANKVVPTPAPRDFRRLVFTGVRSMHYKGGFWAGEEEDWRRNPILVTRGRHAQVRVIQMADVTRCNDGRFQAQLRLDIMDAHYQFDFEGLLEDRRLGRGLRRHHGDEWQYVDIKSERPFDFYEPFPGDLPPDLVSGP